MSINFNQLFVSDLWVADPLCQNKYNVWHRYASMRESTGLYIIRHVWYRCAQMQQWHGEISIFTENGGIWNCYFTLLSLVWYFTWFLNRKLIFFGKTVFLSPKSLITSYVWAIGNHLPKCDLFWQSSTKNGRRFLNT